ncbi:MAG: HIT domain-containing protein [Candidatus Omnitrophota bacterium]
MRKMWAPWRIEYIRGLEGKRKCVLCVGRSKTNDRRNFIVERSHYSFSILNIYPYNNGHIMVAPYRHVKTIENLSTAEMNDIMRLVVKTKRALDTTMKPHGYNIGINLGRSSGAGIDKHLHFHIVPRWNGDTNFMPVISDLKVLSESLESLYDRLQRPHKRKHAKKRS